MFWGYYKYISSRQDFCIRRENVIYEFEIHLITCFGYSTDNKLY